VDRTFRFRTDSPPRQRDRPPPPGSYPSKWVPYAVGAIEGTAGQPLDALEPGSSAPSPEDAVVGGPNGAGGGAVPETPRTEPVFEYPPGEEPRPREGEPTGWSHGELL